MASSSERRAAARFGLAAGAGAACWLFLLSGWLGVQPGRPAALRSDVLFQSDAGQRIDDTLTGTNSFGIGTHFLVGKVWPHAIGILNRQFPYPAVAAVSISRIAAALGAGIGLGIFAGCLTRIGWSRARRLAALAFLLASSYQVVACLPDHFAFSSGLLPAAFGIFLLARRGILANRTAIAILIGAAVLAASICLTNALWPALLVAGLLLEKRRLDWRVGLPAAIVGIVGFTIVLKVIERHGHRWPVACQAKHWLNLRLVNDPGGAMLRIGRGLVDPVVAPSPDIDTNNQNEVPMLTFEPAEAMPHWPFDPFRTIAAIVWLAVLALSLRDIRTPDVKWLAIWIGWNLVFHNLWGDEFFLYSPHYGWALALLPFVSERLHPRVRLALAIVVVGQLLALNEIAARVGAIAM
jgi:hypothetical protein